MTNKMKKSIVIGFAIFGVAIIAFVLGMNIKNMNDSRRLLEDSIKSQLNSITAAAELVIDSDEFSDYTDIADMEKPEYIATFDSLCALADNTGVNIYAIAKNKATNTYFFVFDTEIEDSSAFEEYELDQVYLDAFAGKASSGIMNVDDEYGSFNTGARPIFNNSVVVGIICADIDDIYLTKNIKNNTINIVLLIVILTLVLTALGIALVYLLNKVRAAQSELQKMAMYDKLTELPNRRFLLEHLAEITTRKNKSPFALFFIDLDNFKKVNDNAGHDAGDALLQHIGMYLQCAHENSKVFRPGAGSLNIAARVGGDEFVLVVPDIASEQDAANYAQEILSGFKGNVVDKNIEKYNVGLSIGIALFPIHSENYQVLIKYADMAMYNTKFKGKNSFSVYSDEMNSAN